MHRYLSSFILSAAVYVVVAVLIIYFISVNSYSDKNIKVIDIQKVCLSTVVQKCEHMMEPKPKPVEPKPKPKPKPKPEPKPKPKPIEKKPTPVPEPIPEPEPVEEEPVEEEPTEEEPVEEEPVEEEPTEEAVKEEIVSQPQQIKEEKNISNAAKAVNNDMTEAKREIFIANLIKQINSNKSYPRSARRRSIEGVVEIEFLILADGNVENINIISGHNIFKRSTIEAIENSFPIDIDESLFSFPKKFKINISYILK